METYSRRSAAYFLPFLSGVLLGVGFAPVPLGILAFIGFIPLIISLEQAKKTSESLQRIYLGFFVFHGVSNWWVSSWQAESDPYLMASGITLWLTHPFFFAVPILAYRWFRRKKGRIASLFALPFTWTIFEWAHSLGDLSYPWQALGYTQIYHSTFVQIADVFGVWGVSFFVVAINSALAHCYFLWREKKEESFGTFFRANIRAFVLLFLLILLPLIYGFSVMGQYSHAELLRKHSGNTLRVGVIQPNINPWKKWESGNKVEQVVFQRKIQDSLRNAVGHLDLAVWNETAIPYIILLNGLQLEDLRRWIDSNGTALLSGFPDEVVYKDSAVAPPSAKRVNMGSSTMYYDHFNSALMLQPRTQSDTVQIHHKGRLTPFAERLPFADNLSFAMKWFEWGVGISGWGKGREQIPLKIGIKGAVGSVICIESIYPDFVAEFVRNGATMLAVMTNDGWFNYTPGPAQHYAIAAMRAIETRRYIARAANTGISGFIVPDGSTLHCLPPYTTSALAETIPQLSETTLYLCWGDWFPALLLFCIVIVGIFYPSSAKKAGTE